MHTTMATSFGVIMLARVGGRPKVLPVRDVLHHYVEYRKEVDIRRTKYELARAEARAHILEGLKIALDHLDKIIKTIRESKDTDTARLRLMENFELSRIHAQPPLDMHLQQLTGLQRKTIQEEHK